MTQQNPGERRRYVRLEQQHMLRHEKYVFGAGSPREEEGTIKNYSLGGALFEAKVKYNVGDTLKLAISIRGWERYKNEFYKDDKTSRREPVIILARVVRVRTVIPPFSHRSPGGEELMPGSVHDIAVEFVGLDEGDRWTLLKHIKAQLEKKSETRSPEQI